VGIGHKERVIEMGECQLNENEEVQARWKEFWNDHKDFDSQWARNVLHNLSEFLPFVFKFEAVRHGLEQFYTRSDVQYPADWDWSTDWTGADEHLPAAALRQLPIFRLAQALDAYAYYGLKLDEDFNDLDYILEDFENREGLPFALFPHEWGGRAMDQTLAAAVARRKLDRSAVGVALTAEELAALVKLPRKNIVNLLAPKNPGILKADARGLIPVETARSWLSTRRDFRPSVWQQQSNIPNPAPRYESLSDDPIFVPVASDGTWFSPNDRHTRDGCFYVASGDNEEKFEDYWAALDFLGRSRFPRWRYCDAAGRWRVKAGRGDEWLRKSRAEIRTLLEAPSHFRAPRPQSKANGRANDTEAE
jgi:hypothetical protein